MLTDWKTGKIKKQKQKWNFSIFHCETCVVVRRPRHGQQQDWSGGGSPMVRLIAHSKRNESTLKWAIFLNLFRICCCFSLMASSDEEQMKKVEKKTNEVLRNSSQVSLSRGSVRVTLRRPSTRSQQPWWARPAARFFLSPFLRWGNGVGFGVTAVRGGQNPKHGQTLWLYTT